VAVWNRLGAVVERMAAEEHDRVYALVSHWPHAVSFALAGALSASGLDDRLIGPGLRDLTRTAASSPALWADILMQNTGPVLQAADQVDHELTAIRRAIEARDRDALVGLLERAAAWRRRVG
jgi:prephenate dehydrogenase